MGGWATADLERLAQATEIDVTTARPDGSTRPWVPIWVVRVDDELYIRSWKGVAGAWFRHAQRLGSGRIRVEEDEFAVRFVPTEDTSLRAQIDQVYRSKYGSSGYVQPMIDDPAAATTLQLCSDRRPESSA